MGILHSKTQKQQEMESKSPFNPGKQDASKERREGVNGGSTSAARAWLRQPPQPGEGARRWLLRPCEGGQRRPRRRVDGRVRPVGRLEVVGGIPRRCCTRSGWYLGRSQSSNPGVQGPDRKRALN